MPHATPLLTARSPFPRARSLPALAQILPPRMVGRAKVFGNKLALKDDIRCTDTPYFDAPGKHV